MTQPMIIAEIGCNHKGDINIAKEMIATAAMYCKVDVVKFQKRNNRELLSESAFNAPHPNPHQSYGNTYGEHREKLEFTLEQHKHLQQWCTEFGVAYSSSVWDCTSAIEIASLSPSIIKVPSACNLNKPLLDILANEFMGEIHISLGMTNQSEEDRIVHHLIKLNCNNRTVLYSCTSGYPVPFEDISLLEISRITAKFGSVVKSIGFSGHHLGIAIDSAAIALGASWIERHFTLDRTWKGTDHAASLEPDGMRKVARDCRAVAKALHYKNSEILPIEVEQRAKLKQEQIRWPE